MFAGYIIAIAKLPPFADSYFCILCVKDEYTVSLIISHMPIYMTLNV